MRANGGYIFPANMKKIKKYTKDHGHGRRKIQTSSRPSSCVTDPGWGDHVLYRNVCIGVASDAQNMCDVIVLQ